ncbi:general transcription factor IIF subunit 2 isoform X2 [Cavia porcellus]|uniref:general transcription factor IIF subunit 2 isoform X2 n=1 Tax=Cavia porcellus TaxID=10141 RepID=UPI002FE3EDEB
MARIMPFPGRCMGLELIMVSKVTDIGLFVIKNCAAINMGVPRLLWYEVFNSLGKISRRGIDKLSLEGIVVQRAECRPAASENYMRLKRLQIEESSKPVRLSQQLDKVVTTNYKPVANHQYNIEYERKKKEDGKRARADKQHVLDMLFSAFEKHQYYNLKDLVDITKQPVGYLKEILKEIGIQNVKGIHKNTWELKPEYRHYQGEEKND